MRVKLGCFLMLIFMCWSVLGQSLEKCLPNKLNIDPATDYLKQIFNQKLYVSIKSNITLQNTNQLVSSIYKVCYQRQLATLALNKLDKLTLHKLYNNLSDLSFYTHQIEIIKWMEKILAIKKSNNENVDCIFSPALITQWH